MVEIIGIEKKLCLGIQKVLGVGVIESISEFGDDECIITLNKAAMLKYSCMTSELKISYGVNDFILKAADYYRIELS